MWRVVVALCIAEVLTMLGVFAFPAALPTFLAEWSLSNTEAGWISGVYFAGYTVAVPILVGLTDRVDARRIYLFGAGTSAISALGFALIADGFWTAMMFRALGGVGLAGTYMPGLRALVDRFDGPMQPRAISFYTASFSLGTSASFLVVGEIVAAFDWRWAFAASGIAAALGMALVATLLRPAKPLPPEQPTHLLDYRPVLRNRPAMGYILGYTVHCWELFAARSWAVAFLAFVAHSQGTEPGWSPTSVMTVAAVVAMVASVVGADIAARLDRGRVIITGMVLSAATALAFGFSSSLPYVAVALLSIVHSAFIQADSAALTTGAVHSADAGRRGTTMALHSVLGFTAAFLGPLAVGVVLDLAGGANSAYAWAMAFASVSMVAMLGPLAILWSRRLP